MKNRIIPIIASVLLLSGCQPKNSVMENPFFSEYSTPFGVPPFDLIENEHFLPAFEEGISQQEAEIDAIVSSTEAPTFENTITAFDLSGELLRKVEGVFDKLRSAETSDVIEPLEAAVLWDADKLTKLGATIVLHATGYFVAAGRKTTKDLIEALCNDQWGDDIVRCLNTAPARAVGHERLATYRNLCASAKREFQGDDLLRPPRPEP